MTSQRMRLGAFLAIGLLVALVLAGVVSNYASSNPDGLDAVSRNGCTTDGSGRITGGECPARHTGKHQASGPLAGYGIRGLPAGMLSTGLAGVAGVLVTFGIGAGLFWTVRRRAPLALNGVPMALDSAPLAPNPAGSAAPNPAGSADATSGRVPTGSVGSELAGSAGPVSAGS